MKFVLFSLLLTAQSAFAFHGVINSSVIGQQVVTVDFKVQKTKTAKIQLLEEYDREAGYRYCSTQALYQNAVKATYMVGQQTVTENQDVVISGPADETIETCQAKAFETTLNLSPYLTKTGFPEFVLSHSVEGGDEVKMVLTLAFPRSFSRADLKQVADGTYALMNYRFQSEPIVLNYHIAQNIKHANGTVSVSYLEHGTLSLK